FFNHLKTLFELTFSNTPYLFYSNIKRRPSSIFKVMHGKKCSNIKVVIYAALTANHTSKWG
ncbi:hypothetical protein KJ032_27115, partial [Salmonella enterica subsp. enterica serovar Typhimurium]|nr:hypothetical protein [Salmonella enterica subsp. enterica serovar Typhimurium]